MRLFADDAEVEMALENGTVSLHDRIRIRKDGRLVDTTVGRVIFNSIVPRGSQPDGQDIDIPFLNKELAKNALNDVVSLVYARAGLRHCVEFLDDLKALGFKSATMAGNSVGIKDMVIPDEKKEILAKADQQVEKITSQYQKGVITDGERYNKVIDVWTHANTDVSQAMFEGLSKDQGGFNPIFMMADSGSRGSRDQIRQLAGMRGLMAKPQKKITGQIGEIIESPIKSNFREGLSVLEYFISTHGARKGLADTALKTADAGYLTRRLVDVAQDVTITGDDCGTIRGLEISALKEGEEVIEPLRDRIVGSVALDDVVDPINGEMLVEAGEEITDDAAQAIEDAGIEKVRIRSVLTCEARSRAVPEVLRTQPGDAQARRYRRGGGDHRGAVDRRAGHPAHAPDVPHRRYGEPHRRAVPEDRQLRGRGRIRTDPGGGDRAGRSGHGRRSHRHRARGPAAGQGHRGTHPEPPDGSVWRLHPRR